MTRLTRTLRSLPTKRNTPPLCFNTTPYAGYVLLIMTIDHLQREERCVANEMLVDIDGASVYRWYRRLLVSCCW
jgi:hypothetical protein